MLHNYIVAHKSRNMHAISVINPTSILHILNNKVSIPVIACYLVAHAHIQRKGCCFFIIRPVITIKIFIYVHKNFLLGLIIYLLSRYYYNSY